MVEEIEAVSRSQGTSQFMPVAAAYSRTPSGNYLKALTDAVVLSAQARQVMIEIGSGQTVAEAWLSSLTQPPDLTQLATTANTAGTGGQGDKAGEASLNRAMSDAMANLTWLFSAMSPPKVDIGAIAQVLAQRMAADAVGTQPPLPEAVARANQAGAMAALYVGNLSVTAGGGKDTSASVGQVAVTTIDPSLGQAVAASNHPLVLDLGGNAKTPTNDGDPASDAQTGDDTQSASGQQSITDRRQALIVVRQGGTALPQGTLHVELDMVLPLG